MQHLTLLREDGAFAGWPANYGLWRVGREVVAVVVVGHVAPSDHLHARDMTRPFEPQQLRSSDGGSTWVREAFTGDLRGTRVLSADEHVVEPLRAAAAVSARPITRAPQPPIDFTRDAVLAARTGLEAGAQSWFYRSSHPGTWDGPYVLPTFDRCGVAARGDLVVLGRREALWMLSSARDEDDGEGGTICAHTADGGQTFTLRSIIREADDDGYAIMPASVLLNDGSIVSLIRRPSWLEAWRSEDRGHTWTLACAEVAATGTHGNPASVVLGRGGTIFAVYGRRSGDNTLAARWSRDGGRSWSEETAMESGIGTRDFGYPRTVCLHDDEFLTVYYRADHPDGERWIAGIRWRSEELADQPRNP